MSQSRDFVAQLYRATKSPYATAHVETATNKHSICATFSLYDPSSQTECTNREIVAVFFSFLSSQTELTFLICYAAD